MCHRLCGVSNALCYVSSHGTRFCHKFQTNLVDCAFLLRFLGTSDGSENLGGLLKSERYRHELKIFSGNRLFNLSELLLLLVN